jgi:hypothetical protein
MFDLRLRMIGPGLLGCGMLWFAAAVAQEKSLPADFAAKLSAFDTDVIGADGIAVDRKAVVVAYDPLDWDIAKMEEDIAHDEAMIALAQRRANSSQRAAEVEEFTRNLHGDQDHLAALKMRRKLGDPDGQCGSAEKIKQWQNLIEFEKTEIPVEQGYQSQSQSSDIAAYFENAVVRGQKVLNEATSQLALIQEACRQVHDEEVMDTFRQRVAQANPVAEKAGAEAIAIAKKGRFADIEEIAKKLAILGPVLQVDELMGNEEEAQKLMALEVTLVRTFVTGASAGCKDEAFNVERALAVDRQAQMLGVEEENLQPCLNRLYEGGGGKIDANSFFAFRHCGTTFSGVWQARMVSKADNLSGTAQTTGSVNVGEDHTATVKLTGRITPPSNVILPYDVVQTGTITFTRRETKDAHGMVLGSWPHFITHLTTEAHETTVKVMGHIHTVTVPAVDELENDESLVILNGNKPCDPAKDVWSYH